MNTPITLAQYEELRAAIALIGYGHEREWAENVKPVCDPLEFWSEFAWVVINSGMKNQIAKKIWDRVAPAVHERGESASTVFGHKGKAAAIDYVYANRAKLLAAYLVAPDKIAFLRSLPWIGPITCWHLAKNYGFDVAKPDRHLVRIATAGGETVTELCTRLSLASGDRIATVDLVIWRGANLRMI